MYRISALVLCLIVHALAPTAHAADFPAPAWTRMQQWDRAEGWLPSGRQLIGRSFLVVPHYGKVCPPYEPRVIITFEAERMTEESVDRRASYPVTYEEDKFVLDDSLLSFIGSPLPELRQSIGLRGPSRFMIADEGSGSLFIHRLSRDPESPVHMSSGRIRELNGEELEQFRDHLKQQRDELLARRIALEENPGGASVPQIDTHDFPGGEIIQAVYYGRFEDVMSQKLPGEDGNELAVNIAARRQLINTLYRLYHGQYGKLAVKEREASPQDWVVIANEKRTIEFQVRERFADHFLAAESTVLSTLSTLATASFENGKPDFERFYAFDALIGVRVFLERYMQNPRITRHFEANLDRLFEAGEPIAVERWAPATHLLTVALPWEAATVRDGHAPYGMTWDRPREWGSLITRGVGGVRYSTMKLVTIQEPEPGKKSEDEAVAEWRRFDKDQYGTGEGTPERFVVGQHSVVYCDFKKRIYALVQSETHYVQLSFVAAPQLTPESRAEFRSFVSSIKWNPAEIKIVPRTDREKEPPARGRRRSAAPQPAAPK